MGMDKKLQDMTREELYEMISELKKDNEYLKAPINSVLDGFPKK